MNPTEDQQSAPLRVPDENAPLRMPDENASLRVLDIVEGTSVDGPGLRTAVYFAGCSHCCEGCHNPQSWDFSGGRIMSVDEILAVIEENGFNVTFTGGDPMYRSRALVPLAKELVDRGYTIWCYTGFRYEDMMASESAESYRALLQYVEVLVDGPFVNSLRDIGLRFRGSSNQRMIDIRRSSPENIVLWEDL